MMNCPSTANSYATFWYVTSRPPFTPPTDTPALRARSASAWHIGPGRHQHGDRHRDRVLRLHPDGDFHRQVPTGLIGNDAFQEVDIAGITRPCTKHNYVVKDVKELAKVVRQAFYLARSGRPGLCLWTCPRTCFKVRPNSSGPKT